MIKQVCKCTTLWSYQQVAKYSQTYLKVTLQWCRTMTLPWLHEKTFYSVYNVTTNVLIGNSFKKSYGSQCPKCWVSTCQISQRLIPHWSYYKFIFCKLRYVSPLRTLWFKLCVYWYFVSISKDLIDRWSLKSFYQQNNLKYVMISKKKNLKADWLGYCVW